MIRSQLKPSSVQELTAENCTQVVAGCLVAIVCLLLGQAFSGAQPPTVAGVCSPPPSSAAGNLRSPPPLGQPIPRHVVVACVGSEPITEAMFQHWNAIAAADASKRPPSNRQASEAHKLLVEVMDFLVSADWVIGEAHDLGVRITRSEVRRAFNRLYRRQFYTQHEFQVFLKQTKQTVQDILLRVELGLLSQRIQRYAVAGHRGTRSKERAIKEFNSNFRRKWTSQTYCTLKYAVQDCGHVWDLATNARKK